MCVQCVQCAYSVYSVDTVCAVCVRSVCTVCVSHVCSMHAVCVQCVCVVFIQCVQCSGGVCTVCFIITSTGSQRLYQRQTAAESFQTPPQHMSAAPQPPTCPSSGVQVQAEVLVWTGHVSCQGLKPPPNSPVIKQVKGTQAGRPRGSQYDRQAQSISAVYHRAAGTDASRMEAQAHRGTSRQVQQGPFTPAERSSPVTMETVLPWLLRSPSLIFPPFSKSV